jgi:predicted DNA-binding transcriptional regulator AlpA
MAKKKKQPWKPSQAKPLPRMAPNVVTVDDINDLLNEASAAPLADDRLVALQADSALVLTVPEVCALLKISRSTLLRSEIPGKVKVGGSVRYHKGVLEQWLKEQVST